MSGAVDKRKKKKTQGYLAANECERKGRLMNEPTEGGKIKGEAVKDEKARITTKRDRARRASGKKKDKKKEAKKKKITRTEKVNEILCIAIFK